MASFSKLENPPIWTGPLGSKAETEDIPQMVDTATSADLSLDYLFPHLTERTEEEGGLPPKRTAFNALFKLLGDNIHFLQQGGFYQYEPSLSYKRYAIVMYKGELYQSLQHDNQGHTPDSPSSNLHWKLVVNLKTINGLEPDENGNIDFDLSEIASLSQDNVFEGVNSFKGELKTAKLPIYTGSSIPDANGVKDNEFPTMGSVRELVENIGPGGGGGDYSIKPVTVLSPADGSERVSVLLEIIGEPFNSAFEGERPELRDTRQFQIAKVSDTDWREAINLTRNSDRIALTYENRLEPRTDYKIRVRDITQWGRKSNWDNTQSMVVFTTGDDVGVMAPVVVEIEGGAAVSERPKITASAFSTTDGTDRHYATQWIIRKIHTNEIIFDSEEDRANLTSIRIPLGTLEENTSYELTVRYKGERFGWSQFGVHNFTTAPKFTRIQTPTVNVENDGKAVLGQPTFNASLFRVLSDTGAKDDHESSSWQVCLEDKVIWEVLKSKDHLRSITMPNNILETGTRYTVRLKYHGYLYESDWAVEGFITAEKFEHIAGPVLTVNGAPDNVPENPTLQGSEFTVMPMGRATDTHVSTDWVIYDRLKEREIWASKNDPKNLTSIKIPNGVLETNETYVFAVTYYGKKYGASETAEVIGTTKENFTYNEQPILTVPGAPDNVRETPLLEASPFKTVSDSGETDKHVSSHWTITNIERGAVILDRPNDTENLTSFRVPAGILEPNTAYRFQVSYTGAKHGTSAVATVEARTHEVLAYINDPNLTVAGAPDKVPQTPVLTGSPFSVFSDNNTQDTHKATDWEATNMKTNQLVWSSLNDSTNLTSIRLPADKLVESTEYRFRVRYHGTLLGTSNWGEVRGTTMAAFDYVQTPTCQITSGFVTGPTDVLECPTFTTSEFGFFSSSGAIDTHESTELVIFAATDAQELTPIWSKTINQGQGDLLNITVAKGFLQLSTAYKAKVRHKGASMGYSEWCEISFNTHSTFTYLQAPNPIVPGAPNNVSGQPVISGGPFTVVPENQQDTHIATDWTLLNAADNQEVWASTNDAVNLTSIKIPAGKLQTSSNYKIKVRYKGETLGYSAWAEVAFSTRETFSPIQAPDLTVEQDESGVYEAPFVSASPFAMDEGEDSHVATDWKVFAAADRSLIWSSLSDVINKRAVQIPTGKLKTNTQYIFAVRYKGAVQGWGPWHEVVATTQDVFYNNNKPSLTNANIDRAGLSLRFEFSTPTLYTRPGKTAATHLRVKVFNKTQNNFVDQFTTPIELTGNYVITRENSYQVDESEDIEYQVFYKNTAEDNDDNPQSPVAKRAITINENIIAFLESITGGQANTFLAPTFNIALNFGPQTFDHIKTDWKVTKGPNGNGETVWESLQDSEHKTSITLPAVLDIKSYYCLHVVAYGNKQDVPAQSKPLIVQFRTSDVSGIGMPGQAGFGVGTAPKHLVDSLGFSPMAGTYNILSEDYGNYQDSNGNIYCFVPAFVYSFDKNNMLPEIASASPSAFDIKSFAHFDYSEEKANAAGYVLHRAFIDGGKAKEGFFITKFQVSKGNKSVKNGIAISLVGDSSQSDAPSKDDQFNPECLGRADDALVISKKMTNNKGNCASAFMYAAIAMLSFIHGLHATSKEHCAWYDEKGITNFPKGCNNNALGDVDDKEIKYTGSDTKITQKGNTGSANHFERTTHNGQACGIADINGIIEEVAIGMWIYGSESGKLRILKDSASIIEINKDNVQNTSSPLHEQVAYSVVSNANRYWGHSTANAFYKDQKGALRALCGLMPAAVVDNASNATHELGRDLTYLAWSSGNYSCLRVGGYWDNSANAGLFYRSCYNYGWSNAYSRWGFRASAYGGSSSQPV